MGYQIRYEDATNRFDLNTSRNKVRGCWLIPLFVCVILTAIITMAAKGYLIPGDAAVTRSAAKTFQQEIKGGEDIGAAFAAFCKEIVDGAHLS